MASYFFQSCKSIILAKFYLMHIEFPTFKTIFIPSKKFEVMFNAFSTFEQFASHLRSLNWTSLIWDVWLIQVCKVWANVYGIWVFWGNGYWHLKFRKIVILIFHLKKRLSHCYNYCVWANTYHFAIFATIWACELAILFASFENLWQLYSLVSIKCDISFADLCNDISQ